ncbi:hypothetical protein [Amycolatopsis sp. NPDC004079]|uniref:hypothetical protein n=1 Tax=Amycolatopsis sp. NPDC004079 TaxID=3154549 RepID=UPI0033B83D02
MIDDTAVEEQVVNPTWTPWRAAYAYAEVMRDLMTASLDPAGERAEYFDVPTMLVAYALADYADQEGIVVTRPADLGELSGMRLWERLATEHLVASLSKLSPTQRAVVPASGEPMHDEFFRMKTEIDRNHAGPAAGHAAEQRAAKRLTGERAWFERGEDGQAFVAQMLMTCGPAAGVAAEEATLRVIADQAEGLPAEPLGYRPPPRPYELSEYMAVDKPWPRRGTPQWAVRFVQGELAGRMLLAHYLDSILGGIDLPEALAEPRKAGESAREHAEREDLAKQFVEVQVLLADHAPDVENELMRIRPSDAQQAVGVIVQEAKGWWTTARYDATISDVLPAMTALLDGLVAPERRGDVQETLEVVAVDDVPLVRVGLRLVGTAEAEPFDALHLAAAFAAALFQIPACVPDPKAEFIRLSQLALRLAEGKTDPPHTASSPSSPPEMPTRQADARKKKARKASRKARRQGRR